MQAWGLDLSLFQFDGELTMSVIFLNAEKTVYGRYGSREDKTSSRYFAMAGLRRAMEGALELHAGYPDNKKTLEGKRGAAPPWKTPDQIPALKGNRNVRPADGSRNACVHCHQANDGEAWSLRMARKKIGDEHLWAYPMPRALGVVLDPLERATVKSVTAGSAGEKAGFKAGDHIVSMEGQPIISVADVQWVLQNAVSPGSVSAEVARGESRETLKLELAKDWRRDGDFTWRVLTWSLRHKLVGTEPLGLADDAERAAAGVAAGNMAIKVGKTPPDWVKEKLNSGLKPGDIIVQVDQRKDLTTESRFLGHLFQEVGSGEATTLTVVRGGKRIPVVLKMQW